MWVICIFLVDNLDGASAPVLSEQKRAKDMHLRLLYIFCDENKKEPTPMQNEIKSSQSEKYVIAHEFADVGYKIPVLRSHFYDSCRPDANKQLYRS